MILAIHTSNLYGQAPLYDGLWVEKPTITNQDVDCSHSVPISIGSPTEDVVLSTALVSAGYTNNLSNVSINFIGNIIIDVPTSFDNCQIQFLNGGSRLTIQVVNGGGSVTFTDSKLLGCGTQWHGIDVMPNNSVRMNNCLVYGAFQAIQPFDNATIGLQQVRFYNNVVGVFANSGNTNAFIQPFIAQFSGNVFDTNPGDEIPSDDYAPFLPPYLGETNTLVTFSGTGMLPPDYFTTSYAGVWLENCTDAGQTLNGLDTDPASWNWFSYLRNGIILSNTPASIRFNKFNSIWAEEKSNLIDWSLFPHLYPFLRGHGVYTQDNTLQATTFSYQGFTSETELDFVGRNSFPIRCERIARPNISNVDMGPVDMAITCRGCNTQVRVTNNNIPSAFRRGINLIGCTTQTAIDVNTNTIGIIPHVTYEGIASGIHLEGGTSLVWNGSIASNTITVHNEPLPLGELIDLHFRVGIFANAISGTSPANLFAISGNDVFHANINNDKRITGIRISGSDFLSVNCNAIVGNGIGAIQSGQYSPDANPNESYGIYTTSTANSTFRCNSTDLTYEGFVFEGFCRRTQLIANTIGDHRIGLHLTSTAIFSRQGTASNGGITANIQIHNGNIWTGTNYQIDRGAWNERPYSGTSWTVTIGSTVYTITNANEYTNTRFRVLGGNNNQFRPKDGPFGSANISISPISPTGVWFQATTAGTALTCANVACPNNVSTTTESLELTELERGIAVDSLQFGIFTEPLSFEARRSFYAEVQTHPEIAVGDTAITSFLIDMGGSTVAELYGIEVATKEDLQATEAQKAEQVAILADMTIVQTAIDSLFSLLPSPLTDAAWNAVKPQLEALYTELADLKDTYSLLMSPIETAVAEAADDIKADNEAIETSELWEENQKAVNNVWLSTFAKGNYMLSAEQLAVIYGVATQCPISGGDAVFQAQSIYRTVAAEILFDNESACQAAGIVLLTRPKTDHDKGTKLQPEKQTAVTAILYPNPADDAFIVSFEELYTDATLLVSDITGREVAYEKVQNARYAKVATNLLPNGTYIVTLVSNGSAIWHERLTVAH